jgi:hypothetical protein
MEQAVDKVVVDLVAVCLAVVLAAPALPIPEAVAAADMAAIQVLAGLALLLYHIKE